MREEELDWSQSKIFLVKISAKLILSCIITTIPCANFTHGIAI